MSTSYKGTTITVEYMYWTTVDQFRLSFGTNFNVTKHHDEAKFHSFVDLLFPLVSEFHDSLHFKMIHIIEINGKGKKVESRLCIIIQHILAQNFYHFNLFLDYKYIYIKRINNQKLNNRFMISKKKPMILHFTKVPA
ncbi:hypothetical protein BLOT_002727 [Blomia tropicalis]|nr:hypothetical protein BLOT_002727 [Blomia tropicalis]